MGNKFLHFQFIILAVLLSILLFPKPALAYEVPPYGGHKFIWIKNNRAGFTEEQMQIIAKNYNLVVIGNQHARGDKEIEHADVKRIKQINPNVPVFLYFPTKLRHSGAKYGVDTFKDEWYVWNGGVWKRNLGKDRSITVPSRDAIFFLKPGMVSSLSPSPKPGDANGDNEVDGIDYVVWLNHYNQAVAGPRPTAILITAAKSTG